MQERILVLFAHPSIDRSEANAQLLRETRGRPGVTVVDLYAEYPTYQIDIDREQEQLRQHDVVVFMFPLYWYSTPAMLKEWQDLVLEYGFAYGDDGTALEGKLFLCALTAGAAEQAYCAEGSNHYTLRELLRPIEQTADLCRMQFLAPFALFGARAALEEGRLDSHLAEWNRLLDALRDGRLDPAAARAKPKLNGALDQVIQPVRP